jgi:hypothetical protein
MSNNRYERSGYGPAGIASLPPTIGMTSRAPTIGARKPLRPLPTTLVSMGTNGNDGASQNHWLLPLGIGLALGGLYVIFKR